MSYRCGICHKAVPPKQPRRVHVIYRDVPCVRPTGEKVTGKAILQEIPVCQGCHGHLENGTPLNILQRLHAPEPPITLTPEPVPQANRPVSLRPPVQQSQGASNA